MKKVIFLLLAGGTFLMPVSGQTIVGFVNPVPAAPTLCSDTWTENGVPQSFDPNLCSFDYGMGSLWLYPGTLILDLSGLGTIDSVEVVLIDYCGLGCSYARFFDGAALLDSIPNTTFSALETLRYIRSGTASADQMTITSFEGLFFEIRIFHTAASTVCPPKADVHTESGDVYIQNSCHGVILTSPNGTCFRIRVDDNGGLTTEQVACPD